MQDDLQQDLESLFHAACTRPVGAERKAYLDGACGENADLRARVEGLLVAHEAAGEFLDAPAITGTKEGPGSTIGPYKLLQEIGEGGMGVVYMAEQETPVRRKVALKVIKLGMDTKQVIARFEAERQALALMDHPNIARVFDASSTETGRPYFVMELVRGVPIDEYCDTQNMPTGERLALFVEVCRAVQHAHQKGIIHRDLKPTNVLVTSHDGTPVPKIIDFGVAKATNQRLTERTLFTEFHQIIGTPEYMSPEQAEMSGLDVDTRSDIYSLGVLLYQLLTGSTPADPRDLRTAAYSEMTRMIREDEPQAPSTRISKLGTDGDKVARQRSTDTRALSRRISGELDWIVMKALEKDRTRRYDTASAFAEDVARHLEDRPVEAGPPGAAYRVTKFARRNQKAVLASVLLAVVVGLGIAGTGAGFLRARAEAARSREISDSLQEVLAMTDAGGTASGEELERVLETVRETFGEDHATYAAVLDTLAMRLHDGGDFVRAAELCEEALAVWGRVYGEGHANVAIALARLGRIQRALGDDVQAETSLRAALAIFEGASSKPGLAGYDALDELAALLADKGEYAETNDLLGRALALLHASPSPSHYRILTILERRYAVQLNLPSVDAGATIREVYDEVHGFYPDESPLLGISALGYGRYLAQHADDETAEPYLREAVQRFAASPRPPRAFHFAACDALFQIIRKRPDAESILETDDLLRKILRLGSHFLSPDELATNRRYFATRMMERERFAEALESMLAAHQALVDGERTFVQRESSRDNLAKLAFDVANHPGLEAEAYDRAREAAERALLEEPGHPAMTVALGAVLYRQGEWQQAAETLELDRPLSDVRGGLSRNLTPGDHAYLALTHARLGNDARARAELTLLQTALSDRDKGRVFEALRREAESLIQSTSSSSEGD